MKTRKVVRLVAAAGFVAAALALVIGLGGQSAQAAPGISHVASASPHGMQTRSSHKHASSSNMTYHGGPVETTPAVYISWWGSQWSSGFTTCSGGHCYTSAQAQTYITDFFSNVGGSKWDNINSQYCQGVANGTVNCGSSGTHVQNLSGQLKGTWTDTTTSVPSSPTQSQIASAAKRLMNHVGYSANATYFVFTPTGHSMNGFGTQWCAWHSVTSSTKGSVAYAYMPYQPDAGTSCGMNFVNGGDDSFGHGFFDGMSVVGGHEYAEAETDPHTSSGSYAWLDSSGNEIGDKCAWSASSGNITLGGNYFAVQPLWSNANSGCVMSY